jgi:hypothetical protein
VGVELIYKTQQIKCGSELARDSGSPVNITVECAAVIASKLAPTFDSRWPKCFLSPLHSGVSFTAKS